MDAKSLLGDGRGRCKLCKLRSEELPLQYCDRVMEATLGVPMQMMRRDPGQCAFRGYAVHTMRARSILLL